MNIGDKITVEMEIDAFRYGYKRKEVRVKVGDTLVWLTVKEDK